MAIMQSEYAQQSLYLELLVSAPHQAFRLNTLTQYSRRHHVDVRKRELAFEHIIHDDELHLTFIASSAEAYLFVRRMDGACTAHIVSEYAFTYEECEHSE